MPDISGSVQFMDDRRSKNVMRYLQALHQRRDISEYLKKLKCRTLILVGDQSPFHREAVHISHAMNRRYNALIEVCWISITPRILDISCTVFPSDWISSTLFARVSIIECLFYKVLWALDVFVAGWRMWVISNGGAATIHAGANWALPDRLRVLSTPVAVADIQPQESSQSSMHGSGASVIRRPGPKAEAHQDERIIVTCALGTKLQCKVRTVIRFSLIAFTISYVLRIQVSRRVYHSSSCASLARWAQYMRT